MRSNIFAALTLLLCSCVAAAADDFGDCRIGAYRLPHGRLLDIAPSSENKLRWRTLDGATGLLEQTPDGTWKSTAGWTGKPDGRDVRFDCARQSLSFGAQRARRIPLHVTESHFTVGDLTFAGRLVLPRGARRVPIVVFVHGSEDSAARRFFWLQRLLPASGVGVYVYDKRGTGDSGGQYTQDFETLAGDAVAALRDARRVAGARAGRVGYYGTSQGGWVAPLAATRAAPDFVMVGYGLAVTVIDEDLECIEAQMRLAGHGPAEIALAQEVAKAGHVVFESGLTQGFADFDALRERYRSAPWFRDLRGNFTHLLLGATADQLPAMAKQYDWHTPWRYDPMPALRALNVPQLWALGEADLDAPAAETTRRLESLVAAGKPITIAMFPGAEHGLTEFELDASGGRVSTRYAPGHFTMLRDYALHGRIDGSYGRARVIAPRAR